MSISSAKILIIVFFVLVAGCAPTTSSPVADNSQTAKEAATQRELAVKKTFELNQRAINVAAPILMANAGLCGKLVTSYIGAQFATKDTLPKDVKNTVKSLYGVADNPTVILVAKNSPADGLLETGDIVTHWHGKTAPKGKKGMAFIGKALKDKKDSSPVSLRVLRSGVATDVVITPVTACNSPVKIADSNSINAFADGKSISITRGMMRFVNNDEELATVIGHELAHNSRKHIQAKKANAVVGTVIGAAISVAIGVNVTRLGTAAGSAAHSQGFETEADYVGLYHAARAGFDVSEAPQLWRRMAAENPKSIGFRGGSHPSTAKRFLTLDATVNEINAKKEAGQDLVPEEKKAKRLSQQKSG